MASCCASCKQIANWGARQNAFRNFRGVLAERERKSRLEAELRRFEAALLRSTLARPPRATGSDADVSEDSGDTDEGTSAPNDLLTWQPRWKIVGRDAFAVYDNPWADVSSSEEGGLTSLEFATPPLGSFLKYLGTGEERARRERLAVFLGQGMPSAEGQGMPSAESGDGGEVPALNPDPQERELQEDGWSCLFSLPISGKSSSLENWLSEGFANSPGGARNRVPGGENCARSKVGEIMGREGWGVDDLEEPWDPWRALFSPTRGGKEGPQKKSPPKAKAVHIIKNEPKGRNPGFDQGLVVDIQGGSKVCRLKRKSKVSALKMEAYFA